MPRGQQVTIGTAGTTTSTTTATTSPLNDVVNALSRKLNTTVNIETVPPKKSPEPSRRPSFSMDNILHPHKKDKKRDDSKERDSKKEKRLSMGGTKAAKSKDKYNASASRIVPAQPGKLQMIVESPPLVLYGNAGNSTGALFSGRLKLVVDDPSGSLKLNEFVVTLRAIFTTHKPIGKDCKPCHERTDELKKWTLISEATTYSAEKDNQFPVSYLFPGKLPASTQAQLGSIEYSFLAKATTSSGEVIQLIYPIKVQRAIPTGIEKTSIRIFPPTNLTGRVQLPQVVHPIGTFPVKMTLSGVVEKRNESQTRWRMRKMMWRIEEQCTVISTPCAKHAHKVSEGKGLQHSDNKLLSSEDLKSGWKTDFDTQGGEISMEFEASLASRTGKVACDVDSPTGLSVKHILIIELIVAEEFCPNKNTSLITPTGAARVLRMQFNINVTERAGMGISWDEEMPPMYEDVPPSPPSYGGANKNDEEFGNALAEMEDYSGPTIVPLDLERLSTHNSDGLPQYREIDPYEVNEGLPMRDSGSLHYPEEAESSTRRGARGFRLDDLEIETEELAHRRRLLEQAAEGNEEEDFGEGSAGQAASHQ